MNENRIYPESAETRAHAAELELLNDELRAAEARYRGIVDAALDAIITTDAASVITGWNKHAEVIFGWTADEALGRTLSETIIPTRHKHGHQRGVEHYIATGEGPILNKRIEITALRRDGTEFPVELTVAPAHARGHIFFSAFIRDLTERHRIERRRAAEHAATRVLAQAESVEEGAQLVLQVIGEALGWTVGFFWLVHESSEVLREIGSWHVADVEAAPLLAATAGAAFSRDDGLPGLTWRTGEPQWMQDVRTDVRFIRSAEAAAAGVHAAFAFPVRAGADIIGVIEFLHPEALAPDEDLLRTVEMIGEDIGQFMRRVHAEAQRDLALQGAELLNMQLIERTAEAEAANRAKSDFLANMSHEFRTPMNAIIGYSDLLDAGIKGELTDAQKELLHRIKSSSAHLLGLVEDVLDLATIEAGHLAITMVEDQAGPVIDAALLLIAPQAAERELTLENDCGSEGLQFYGDVDRVRQIVANLLANAVKFTEPGGRITVRCNQIETADEKTKLIAPGPWLRVVVEDNGIGIAPDVLDNIFEPFIQAEAGHTRTKGGTGLGLTISRRLARLMGGDVSVVSTPGVGSAFSVTLGTRRFEL